MRDTRQEIADLEKEVERLSGIAERAREIMGMARSAIGFGVLIALATASGIFALGPVFYALSVPFILGGFIVYGSNKSTCEQYLGAVQMCEARRTELIDALTLAVTTERGLLH